MEADTSATKLLYRKETGFNQVLPTPNAMQALRFTKENLQLKNTTVVSNEIVSDGSTTDLLLVGQNVTGGFDFELSGGSFDDFLQGVLRNTFGAAVNGSSTLVNGTTAQPSFQFEKQFPDIGEYLTLRGCTVSDLDLTISARQIVTGTLGFMGASGAMYSTSKATAITAATVTPVFTSGPGVDGILVNGADIGVGVKEIKLSIKNNLRERAVVDDLATLSHGRGKLDITGSFNLYFTNGAMYNYFATLAGFSLAFTLSDNLHNAYDFLLPNCKIPDDDAGTIGGDNQDVMETFSFRALRDATPMSATLGKAIQVVRRTF